MCTRLLSILIVVFLATPAFAQTTVRGERDDTSPTTCAEGAQCSIRETANRAFHVNMRNASGDELGTASDPFNVEGTLSCNLAEPISVDDNGGSLTVDASNLDIRDLTSASDSVAAVQSGTWVLGANSGVDIGDVTVNNAAGASAVNIQDGGNSITVDGTVAATQSGTWDEVGINDSGNSITVDNSTLSVVGGGTEATALRVTVANDSTGVLSVDDNGGSLTVDGTVAATQSGTWDEVGINDSGNSITVDNSVLSVVGSGTEATAQRVTIATDSTGVLSVDDNGGSLTIDGTVTVGTFPDNEPVNVAQLAGTTTATNSGTNSAGTLRVTVATNDEINDDIDAIMTSEAIIDDWDNAASDGASVSGDVAHDAADAGEPVKIGAKAFSFETASAGTAPGQTAVAANDRVNMALNLRGEVPITPPAIYNEPTNIDTTYDDSPTTATSGAIDVDGYNYHCLGFELTKANTPTDILIEILIDLGDGNIDKKLMNDMLGDWRYDDTAVGSSGVKEVLCFSATADQMEIKVTATGTTASNTFTMANSVLRSTVMK